MRGFGTEKPPKGRIERTLPYSGFNKLHRINDASRSNVGASRTKVGDGANSVGGP